MHTFELNDGQKRAVQAGTGPVLVVAGAGTGKTRVLVERIKRLLNEGIAPSRILALTFTEKAAAEMQDRVNEATQTLHTEMPLMTFNAYGESMLRQYAADIGLSRNFTLIGDNAQLVFLRERIDQLGLDYFAPVSRPDGQLTTLAEYVSHLKQYVITPDIYDAYVNKLPNSNEAERLDKQKHQELAHVYRVYIELAQAANVIDYDDQIYLFIQLLHKRPNVLKAVQAAYDYILVDEFQDTNVMQAALVDLIAAKHQNLFVVGDDDQSIYGWRGASLANILDFKDRYPDTQEISLIQNYRSTQEILDSAYRLIQHNNPDRLEERLQISKRLVTGRRGTTPQICNFDTLDAELSWIANDIKSRLKKGTKPEDIAILARRNATVQRLHSQLEFANINHVVIGQRYQLYSEPIVRLLLEALKACVDPLDNTSLYHTLVGPLFNLPASELSQLSAQARRGHQSLAQTIRDEGTTECKKSLETIESWRDRSSTLTVGQLAYHILEDSGYKDMLYEQASEDPSVALSATRLNEYFKTLKEFERIASMPSAIQYLDALPALQAAGESGEDDTLDLSNEAVNVLSVHKAKGLEWPVVYIADCTEGSFPLVSRPGGLQVPAELISQTKTEADDHMREERRLMYVAMTRAKDELIMTYSQRHSSSSTRKPSRFITEACEDQLPSSPMQTEMAIELAGIGSFGLPAANNVAIPESILKADQVSLTVSQVKSYLDCPLDFYYRYILCVPQEPSANQTYGTLIHSLLEDINHSVAARKLLSLKDLEQRLLQNWPQLGYLSAQQRERAVKQGLATLRRLHADISAHPRTPLAVEEAFSVRVPDANLTVRGRFDAVFATESGVEIVDYKTTSGADTPEKAKSRASASEQLTLYALAWQALHDEIPALVTLDFVETGQRGSLRKTQRGIDGAYTRLQKVADGIRGHQFAPGREHTYCVHPQV